MSLQLYFPKPSETLRPFFTIPVAAGQAHQIEQIIEWINLDEYVRRGTESSYYIRVSGDSMQDVDIYDGDLLVVERTECAETGDIVIAEINGEFTVKELKIEKSKLHLVPANGNYKSRQITRKDNFTVWGNVLYIIHKPRRRH